MFTCEGGMSTGSALGVSHTIKSQDGGRRRTVGEELAEHEGVVGLGVVLGQRDVLVHVEGHDIFEAARPSTEVSHPSLGSAN